MPACAATIMRNIPQAVWGGRRMLRKLSRGLLDGKRSGFVNGANFLIDGGMTRKMIHEA